jgi:hypothetical protein
VPASVAAARGLEESFVVLGAASILRPQPGGGRVPAPTAGAAAVVVGAGAGAAVGGGDAAGSSGKGAGGASVETAEEVPPASGAGGADGGPTAAAAAAAAGFDGKLQSLTALFEMASGATGVDHPLCLDCAVQLKEEVEAQVGTGVPAHD